MLIGAVFGMVFVAVNANSPLDAAAGLILRGAAALGLAVVVGVHFVALAPVWRQRSILMVGVLLTLLGTAGLGAGGPRARRTRADQASRSSSRAATSR